MSNYGCSDLSCLIDTIIRHYEDSDQFFIEAIQL